jgi:hypothetical protein
MIGVIREIRGSIVRLEYSTGWRNAIPLKKSNIGVVPCGDLCFPDGD